MILNAFAVLDAFVTLIRFLLASTVLGISLSIRPVTASHLAPGERYRWENRNYLAVLLSLLLLSFHLVAWPLQYALLQSYVSQWPGVMCIYGVLRVGTGSDGVTRWLPDILTGLQCTKPLAVFFGGGLFVLYLANRQTTHGSMTARMLATMTLFGAITVGDSLLEGTYLLIPKKEHVLEAGCCSAAINLGQLGQDTEDFLASDAAQPWLSGSFFLLNGLLAATTARQFWSGRRVAGWASWMRLAVAVLVSLPLSSLFLVHVAAPRILGLPFHHCPYELLVRAPESILGIAAFTLGLFALGWTVLLGGRPLPEVAEALQRLLFLSFFGYAMALTLFATELVLS